MAASDVLNGPIDDRVPSPLNPQYSYTEGLPEMRSIFQAKDGTAWIRRTMARGRTYDLAWQLSAANTEKLRQWEAQYDDDFFTYYDGERNRYFSGMFGGPLQYSPPSSGKCNIKGQFIEIPGVSMYRYPADWDGFTTKRYRVRDGFGRDLCSLVGIWTYETGDAHEGGAAYKSKTAGATAEWLYYGYGFRVWSKTGPDCGKLDVLLDNVVVQAAVDLYSAAVVASAPLVRLDEVSLGLHRITLRCTGSKNVAATDCFVLADLIEVMR